MSMTKRCRCGARFPSDEGRLCADCTKHAHNPYHVPPDRMLPAGTPTGCDRGCSLLNHYRDRVRELERELHGCEAECSELKAAVYRQDEPSPAVEKNCYNCANNVQEPEPLTCLEWFAAVFESRYPTGCERWRERPLPKSHIIGSDKKRPEWCSTMIRGCNQWEQGPTRKRCEGEFDCGWVNWKDFPEDTGEGVPT